MAIAAEIYHDNDADVVITDLPTGLTVEWFIGATAAATTPVNAAVSGTCGEAGDPPVYTDVLEGAAITDHLTPDVEYFLIVKVGQDLRVYGTTTVRALRLANA